MMLNWSYIPPLKEWKNMKRILASVLVLSFLSMGFVGCGDKKADKPKAATPAATPSADAAKDAAKDKK